MATARRTQQMAGIPHKQGTAKYSLVQYYMEVLRYCYPRYKPTLDRLQALTNIYDNVIDKALFPTISKMSIPDHFSMTQEALPDTMDLIFPDSLETFGVMPVDVDVDMETLDKVQYALNFQVRQRMRAKMAMLPVFQNAIKTGIGYAAVVPTVVTPFATINKRWIKDGRGVANTRNIGIGATQKALQIENVGLGEVVPSDDGADFNGHNRVSHCFRFKIYSEGAFRRLFAKMKADTEDIDVDGDVEYIIQQARDFNYTTAIPFAQIIADLGGIDINYRPTATDNSFIQIPVIQCYGEQEVVWLANGTTVIYHEKDNIQTLHRPLIKASVTVDGNRWHPMNPAEASAAISNGRNLYYNMLFDLMVRATNPIGIYQKSKFGDKPPVMGANGFVGIDGPVGDALVFPPQPQMNNGHAIMENMLEKLQGRAVGQSANMQEPTAGMVRGGLHAFESILNSSRGRQRLGAMILEMGALEPLGQLTMIYMQLMASGEGLRFSEKEFDTDTGKGRLKYTTVSFEEINAAYEVSIDTRAKARTETDLNERVTVFNAVKDDPYFDPYTTRQFLVGAYPTLKTGLYSREKSRKIQEQIAEQQRVAAEQASTNNVPGGTPQSIEAGATLGGAQ